jgi:hypothetical protein
MYKCSSQCDVVGVPEVKKCVSVAPDKQAQAAVASKPKVKKYGSGCVSSWQKCCTGIDSFDSLTIMRLGYVLCLCLD